jgi:Fe-S cluster assembly ATP-binding protein
VLQRLLEYIVPTQVHIMKEGKIVQTGGLELVDQLEAGGYASLSSIDDAHHASV